MRTNIDQLEQLLLRVARQFGERERKLDTLPVSPPGLRELARHFHEEPLAEAGIGEEAALDECFTRILPGLSNTALRDFSLVIGGATPAAILGDVLATLWDQCVILHDHDSLAPVVEEQAALLLLDLFRLRREDFAPTFTTGASASNLVALASARQWWGRQHGVDVAEAGLAALPAIEVFAGAPHSSIGKALSELGLGRTCLRRVGTLPGRTAVDTDALDQALRRSTAKARVVVASAGEVNTGDFDDLERLADLCRTHGAWLHVDAAFGLFARCSPAYEALCRGVEHADSIAADLHKLLNVPYDAGFVMLASRHRSLLQEVFSAVAPYIGGQISVPGRAHPMNQRVENSARFRGLPAWMTLKAYGRQGYQRFVERTCAHARELGAWLETSSTYELLSKPMFNIVLFRGRTATGAPIERPEDNRRLLDAINGTGEVFLTPTVHGGLPAIRTAFAKWQTTDQDVARTKEALAAGIRAFTAQT